MQSKDVFYKHNESDKIWWKNGGIGEWLFSFDKIKIYNMFQDYPQNMTADEVEVFDKENPFWADFFKDRR